VRRPGNFELPLGFPMTDLIYDVCGGIRDGNDLKSVIPGGASVPFMTVEEVERCSLDYEGVQECGSMLGCASVMVMDETTDIVKQARRLVQFFAHESCGQCTPCREGTSWVEQIMRRIEGGRGTEEDLATLMELGDEMTGTTICVLSDSCAVPVRSSIEKFADDYLALIRRGERVGTA
jgi:NADH-quinone oxidoreductase subunit F